MEQRRYSVSIHEGLGLDPDYQNDCTGVDVGKPWDAHQLTVGELVKAQSPSMVNGRLRGGKGLSPGQFRSRTKDNVNLLKTGMLVLDIDAKPDNGWTVEKINEVFPTVQDWIDKGFGDKLAAVLPTTSVPLGVTATIGHLFFPLERAPIRSTDFSCYRTAQQGCRCCIPHLVEKAVANHGMKGGPDPCADKLAQFMAGMRGDQEASYVNEAAYLSREWIQATMHQDCY